MSKKHSPKYIALVVIILARIIYQPSPGEQLPAKKVMPAAVVSVMKFASKQLVAQKYHEELKEAEPLEGNAILCDAFEINPGRIEGSLRIAQKQLPPL